MNVLIYFIIMILFVVLIFWTWNNSKEFPDTSQRIKFVIIGIIVLAIVTWILFFISKIGVMYPNKEIMKKVRKIALFVFIPINGFFTLPHIANIMSEINNITNDDEKTKKRIKKLAIIIAIVAIIEIIYLKDFQKGTINIIKYK